MASAICAACSTECTPFLLCIARKKKNFTDCSILCGGSQRRRLLPSTESNFANRRNRIVFLNSQPHVYQPA